MDMKDHEVTDKQTGGRTVQYILNCSGYQQYTPVSFCCKGVIMSTNLYDPNPKHI